MVANRKALIALFFILVAPAARPGIPVIDVANLAQTITQVTQAVQQLTALHNQIRNQVNMINLQLKHVRQLPGFIDSDVSDQLTRLRMVVANTRGLLNNTAAVTTVYANTFGGSGAGMAARLSDIAQWLQQVDNSALNALQAIASLSIQQDQGAITRVMSASQQAVGQLQALQALNQFNAITTRQLSQSNLLLAKQAELLAIAAAQQAAESRQMTQLQQRLDADLVTRATTTRIRLPTLQ